MYDKIGDMSKKKNNSEYDFAELYYYTKKLEKKNEELAIDNVELAKKLNAKRYKLVDYAVDSIYSVLNRRNNRKEMIKRNLQIRLDSFDYKLPKRKITKGRVDIINVNFYDWDGEVLYKGGAERYVFDLACLLKKAGYNPRILQCSNKKFEKIYRGIDVIGIGSGDKNDMKKCSTSFAYYCRSAELIIASPLELAANIIDIPIIGINHGINFDGDWNHYSEKYSPDYSVYMEALEKVKSCVCVDTNFINWTRTIDYANSVKEVYIPNYYDDKSFKVAKKKNKDKIVFVYPRRIYNARGADITIEAFDKVLSKYKEKVILNFVGQIDNDEIGDKLNNFMNKYHKNVFHFEYEMSEMSKAYEDADVVLVPTRYCEGTSLSCIEGMASGAAVITTTVGGLPNLVIDGYNGRLIAPTAEDLEKAVVEMITNSDLRNTLAENGKKVAASSFKKDIWDKKWLDLVECTLDALH